MEARLDVSKWQAAREQFHYDPVLWFFYRFVEVAYLDAKTTLWSGEPSDEALLARDWIARSEDPPPHLIHDFVSFPLCCRVLGLNPDNERTALLEAIDKAVERNDEDCAWARLDVLSALEPKDDIEPLFDAPRIVPVLDQIALF
ncbi:MAG TPA: hypothetical protein VFB43_00925 [Terracidiphilus sp.]|nr:hypothetical protein [Terracidiphilus sp.]